MNSVLCSAICKYPWCEASRDDSEEIKVSTTRLAASLLSPAILHHQAAKASHHLTHQHFPHPVFSKQKVPPASLNHPPTPSAGQSSAHARCPSEPE